MGNAWQGVARSEAPPLHMPSPILAVSSEEDEEVEDKEGGGGGDEDDSGGWQGQ